MGVLVLAAAVVVGVAVVVVSGAVDVAEIVVVVEFPASAVVLEHTQTPPLALFSASSHAAVPSAKLGRY